MANHIVWFWFFDAVIDSHGDSFAGRPLSNVEPDQTISRSIQDGDAAFLTLSHVHYPEQAEVIFEKEDGRNDGASSVTLIRCTTLAVRR